MRKSSFGGGARSCTISSPEFFSLRVKSLISNLLRCKIFRQFSNKTTLARDWRVVGISEEDSAIDVATLYLSVVNHIYDSLEPFSPLPGDSGTIRAEIGSSQKGPFQDVPLTVRVCEVAGIFGVLHPPRRV